MSTGSMFSPEEVSAMMDQVPPMLGARCGAAEGCDLARGSYCISFTSPASCKPCAGSCSRLHGSWGHPDCNTRCPIAMFKEQFFDIMGKAAKVKEAQSQDADATMTPPPCPDVSEVLHPYQLAVGLLAGLLLVTIVLAAVLCYLLYHKIGFDCRLKRWFSRSSHVASGDPEPAQPTQRIQYRNQLPGQEPSETDAMLRPVADAASQTAEDLTSPSGGSSRYRPDPLLVPDGATAASANQDTDVKGPSNQANDSTDVKLLADRATVLGAVAGPSNVSLSVERPPNDCPSPLNGQPGSSPHWPPDSTIESKPRSVQRASVQCLNDRPLDLVERDQQPYVASQNTPHQNKINGTRKDQNRTHQAQNGSQQQQNDTQHQQIGTRCPIPASHSNGINGQASLTISPSGQQTHNQALEPYATDSRLRLVRQPDYTEDSTNYPYAVQSPKHAVSCMYVPS